MGMYVTLYVKKKGAYGVDQTEKVGAFRAERMVKVVPLELLELGKMGAFRKSGTYRGTYPYCFNMGVSPPGVQFIIANWVSKEGHPYDTANTYFILSQ